MSDYNERLNQLQARLEKMVEYQNYFYREINLIRDQINSLKQAATPSAEARPKFEHTYEPPNRPPPVEENTVVNQTPPVGERPIVWGEQSKTTGFDYKPKSATAPGFQVQPRERSGLEEFIGRNLISIVGIIITIIGVGIGTKYAIDNNLISPAMRILAGYLFGAGLFGIAVWLKEKYLNFSAVLLSGALAILYFITYFAYAFYGLMPQTLAFVLMLLVTIATVGAALNYNRQIIAHIGLVGAYAVPFLLSGNNGSAAILFAYIAIINFGVLAVSIRKYWKPLFYTSFGFTWLIYAAWYLTGYRPATDLSLAITFLTVFFLTFYTTFIAYKLIAREEFGAENVFLLLANSFVFYGLGTAVIASQPGGNQYLGLFTIGNAALHFAVAATAKKYALVDAGNINFLAALGLVFVTLAIPVELRGHWITLMWTAEAVILFWLGRTKHLPLYEYFSYPLMGLAFLSLLKDWATPVLMDNYSLNTPILNAGFATTILFVAAFGFIYYVYKNHQAAVENSFDSIAKYALPTIILIALYNAFRIEIGNYFESEIARTALALSDGSRSTDNDLHFFSFIWQLDYSMFFLTALSIANARKIKSDLLGLITLGLSSATLLFFLTGGLYVLGELRSSYLSQADSNVFSRTSFHLVIRYLSFLFVAGLIIAAYKYIAESLDNRFPELKLNAAFDFVFYVALFWLASSELLNWGAILQISDSDKLGLSVLWGIYALCLVIVGIAQRKKYLRIGAIVLFTFTLIKLFFYDIATLSTISKTIVFVSLGILLLIISFLYNKYKHLIFDESEASV
ncbi:MAG: DUF2339 domain-containing protein [Pyrinomonadaceae bacterium]